MKKYSKIVFAVAALAVSASVFAQTQLKVSTGTAAGTYSTMFKQFQAACKDQILQIEVPSTGAVQNMDRILGNEVNAAIVQTDVLFMRARNEDLSGIKTLFSLYPEEVHVFAPAVSPLKDAGNMVGMGKKPLQFNTVADLRGQRVAAWGGSIVTAQLIRIQGELQFEITEVKDFAAAKAAADAGEVAAVIMVGGQPMGDVAKLTNAYKLLPFPEALTSKLKAVYTPAKLNYSGMGQGGSGVQTIATDALYVTRAYKTAKFVESLSALRNCFTENLPMLQEETGMHKKWAAVNADNKGKWPYYELPAVSASSAVLPKANKK
jgi:TRAP-type uncharacterized transport system substrate-binding protein